VLLLLPHEWAYRAVGLAPGTSCRPGLPHPQACGPGGHPRPGSDVSRGVVVAEGPCRGRVAAGAQEGALAQAGTDRSCPGMRGCLPGCTEADSASPATSSRCASAALIAVGLRAARPRYAVTRSIFGQRKETGQSRARPRPPRGRPGPDAWLSATTPRAGSGRSSCLPKPTPAPRPGSSRASPGRRRRRSRSCRGRPSHKTHASSPGNGSP